MVHRLQKLEHEQGDFRKNDTGNGSHLAKPLPRATGDCHPLQPSSHIRNFLAGEKSINKIPTHVRDVKTTSAKLLD